MCLGLRKKQRLAIYNFSTHVGYPKMTHNIEHIQGVIVHETFYISLYNRADTLKHGCENDGIRQEL